MGKTPIQQLQDSCSKDIYYPRNLVKQSFRTELGDTYHDRLNEHETRLFDDSHAKLDFVILKYSNAEPDLESDFVTSIEELEQLFPAISAPPRYDDAARTYPQSVAMSEQEETANVQECSMFFISAPHSRARLRISRRMLTFLCSAYQVPPSFLDFVFPFGLRTGPLFHDVSPVRDESRLLPKQKGLDIPSLKQSGRDIRICYNLRSVERLANASLPWSIRQNTTYHTFDIITGNTLWINIKGNQLIRSRVESQLKSRDTTIARSNPSFAASLAMHMVLIEWAGENWRAYIEDLEYGTQVLTSETLVAPVQESVLAEGSSSYSPQDHAHSKGGTRIPRKQTGNNSDSNIEEPRRRPPRRVSASIELPRNAQAPRTTPNLGNKTNLVSFSFHDLQVIQNREEKIKEAIVVLELNRTTLKDIRSIYEAFAQHLAFDIQGDREDLDLFKWQVIAVEKEIDTQRIRAKALLEQLQERKSLLNSILQYRSMKASEFFADQALRSSKEMETLSQQMHLLAVETKQETVSMRVITLVTLFFLPGTFVATFLSTDVLRWTDGVRQFETDALSTYFALSLPMTAITFVMWYGMYRTVQYKKDALPTGFMYEDSNLIRRALELFTPLGWRKRDIEKPTSV